MKFIKDGFRGAPNGHVYALVYSKGDECPKELELAAMEQGFLKENKKGTEQDSLLQSSESQSE